MRPDKRKRREKIKQKQANVERQDAFHIKQPKFLNKNLGGGVVIQVINPEWEKENKGNKKPKKRKR